MASRSGTSPVSGGFSPEMFGSKPRKISYCDQWYTDFENMSDALVRGNHAAFRVILSLKNNRSRWFHEFVVGNSTLGWTTSGTDRFLQNRISPNTLQHDGETNAFAVHSANLYFDYSKHSRNCGLQRNHQVIRYSFTAGKCSLPVMFIENVKNGLNFLVSVWPRAKN